MAFQKLWYHVQTDFSAKNANKRGDWVAGAGAGGDYYEDEGDYDNDDESSEGSFGEE